MIIEYLAESNVLLYIGFAVLIIFIAHKLLLKTPESTDSRKEMYDVLTKDEYKVKGRYD